MNRSLAAFLGAILLACGATTGAVTIVVIGDSTVSTYKANQYPWAGWGQELSLYFKTGSVNVVNHAVGGRSSRSFVQLGQWASTVPDLKAGEWLFIQFGHNDRDAKVERYTDTADYKTYLAMFIDSARKLGVHPVLVTPMNMNTWNGTKVREVFSEGASNYWAAMKHVGAAKNVPVLDLGHKSTLLMDTLGRHYLADFHFMGLDAGEYPNYATGYTDTLTHFQEEGAEENARMITEEIVRQSTDSILAPLAVLVVKRYAADVGTNLASGGIITRSRVFPSGATVTVKVKPAAGKTFRYWANANGDSLTKARLLTYVQDTLPHKHVAVFAGATGVERSSDASAGDGPRILGATRSGSTWNVHWSGDAAGLSLRVVDLRGRILMQRGDLAGTDGSVSVGVPAGTGLRLVQLLDRGRILDGKAIVPPER